MLPRNYRLPARSRLHATFSHKFSFGIVKVAKNNLEHSRLGVIIAKKVAKNAVDRNRSRRILHSVFVTLFERLLPGQDYLVILNKNLAKSSSKEVEEEIIKIIK